MLQVLLNLLLKKYRMMMEFTTGKSSIVRSMVLESITIRMGISMKETCLKDICKGKASTLGKMEIFMKEHSLQIK